VLVYYLINLGFLIGYRYIAIKCILSNIVLLWAREEGGGRKKEKEKERFLYIACVGIWFLLLFLFFYVSYLSVNADHCREINISDF
jgi:hypothetical protein